MQIKTITKEEYPYLLQQITQLPRSLDYLGKMPSNDNKFLCVIGSRSNTSYGFDACNALIKGLQGYPVVIVSGLAVGIDSISHEAALESKLTTMAFPGSGLANHVIYPASKRMLARKIVESGGAVVSPFKINQIGGDWTFPYRNRLMAGVSHATLIIEAKKGSGTLLTAGYATEFNRDILVVPGSIFSESSYGPHILMERGAIPVNSSRDILRILGFIDDSSPNQATLSMLREISLTPDERLIVDLLQGLPASSTDLITKTSFSSSHFNMVLTELELRGIVRESGGLYRIRL